MQGSWLAQDQWHLCISPLEGFEQLSTEVTAGGGGIQTQRGLGKEEMYLQLTLHCGSLHQQGLSAGVCR